MLKAHNARSGAKQAGKNTTAKPLQRPASSMLPPAARLIAAAAGVFGLCITAARAWQADKGDGTFTNPPLYADYPALALGVCHQMEVGQRLSKPANCP